MKVILSRKGFDSANGGCASPILHPADDNGIALSDKCMLLSLPIPAKSGVEYSKLIVPERNGLTYDELLSQLRRKQSWNTSGKKFAHVDPDIRRDIRKEPVPGWKPAFGQTGASASFLNRKEVGENDLFLFFGWFHNTRNRPAGCHFVTKRSSRDFYESSHLQIIYGYLQVGSVLRQTEEIQKYFWHPHALEDFTPNTNNTLYIPREKLHTGISEIDDLNLPGFRTFNYSQNRVLTEKGCSRATWTGRDCYRPENLINGDSGTLRKNSATDKKNVFYNGIWQELILKDTSDNPGLKDWLVGIFKDEAVTPD